MMEIGIPPRAYDGEKRTRFHPISRVSSDADSMGTKNGFKKGATSGTTKAAGSVVVDSELREEGEVV